MGIPNQFNFLKSVEYIKSPNIFIGIMILHHTSKMKKTYI